MARQPKKRRPLSYQDNSKSSYLYTPVKSGQVPGGLTWKRADGRPGVNVRIEYSMMRLYKRVVDLHTGDTAYFKRLDIDDKPIDAAAVDAEPDLKNRSTMNGKRRAYLTGARCWFIDTDARWYLCTVVKRVWEPSPRITICPVTGYDDTREKPWPYGDELEFSAMQVSHLFQRLRPLDARTP